jgi:hypothetical protein
VTKRPAEEIETELLALRRKHSTLQARGRSLKRDGKLPSLAERKEAEEISTELLRLQAQMLQLEQELWKR